MLTDIFAERYASRVLWENFTETESKLLVQCFRIVEEQLIPYWVSGKESPTAKAQWKSLHDRLSMELALQRHLSALPKFAPAKWRFCRGQ